MTHFQTTIEIKAPLISIRSLDPGPIAVGAEQIVRQSKVLPSRWHVTEADEGRSFAWTTLGRGIRVTARHAVEDAGNISRVTLSADFSGPLGPPAARLARRLNAGCLYIPAHELKKPAGTESR